MKKHILQLAALLLCLACAAGTLSACAKVYQAYEQNVEEQYKNLDARTEEEIGRALNTALIDMVAQDLPVPAGGTITVTASGLQFSQPGDFSAFEASFAGIIDVSKLLHPAASIRYQVDGYTVTILK